jgi:probable HAF family extracellular repeat protein
VKVVSEFRRLASVAMSVANALVCLFATISLSAFPASAQQQEFAYVGNVGIPTANTVFGFKVDPVTGNLVTVPGSPFTSGTSGVSSIAIDQKDGFVYVANGFGPDNNISGFRIDPLSGRLLPLRQSPFATGPSPMSIAVSLSGKFAYVANQGSNSVSAFKIESATGNLIPVPGSPFAAGNAPSSVTVDPAGAFVYVTNESSNDVSGFTVNSTTGALKPVPGSPFPAGTSPQSVAVDPLDRFVYVANQGSDNVSGYSLNNTTGALTSLGVFAAGAGGLNGVNVDPTGKFVYAEGYGGVYGYQIVLVSKCFPCVGPGSLTPLPGSPFGTGTNAVFGAWTPNSLAIDFSDSFAYATSGPYGSGNVTGFDLNAGGLTQFPGLPFPSGNGSVAIALSRPPAVPLYSGVRIPDANFQPLISISASAINNQGQVAGSALVNSANETLEFAFLYSKGTTGSGGILGKRTIASDLNDAGQVVGTGTASLPIGNFIVLNHAYRFSNGTTTDLDNRQGGASSAFGINNNGEITGSMSSGTCTLVSVGGGLGCTSPTGLGDTHAFLDTGSGLKDIGTLGGNFSEGRGINNMGEIVGGSNTVAGGIDHVFIYYRGAMRDLGAFEGQSSEGTAINDNGQVIGTTGSTGFLWQSGAFHLLPTLPGGTFNLPAGINNRGDIVGSADIAGPAGAHTRAYLYANGAITDLNLLVEATMPLLTSASGINNKGQIVASGIDGQLYLLTPR